MSRNKYGWNWPYSKESWSVWEEAYAMRENGASFEQVGSYIRQNRGIMKEHFYTIWKSCHQDDEIVQFLGKVYRDYNWLY